MLFRSLFYLLIIFIKIIKIHKNTLTDKINHHTDKNNIYFKYYICTCIDSKYYRSLSRIFHNFTFYIKCGKISVSKGIYPLAYFLNTEKIVAIATIRLAMVLIIVHIVSIFSFFVIFFFFLPIYSSFLEYIIIHIS